MEALVNSGYETSDIGGTKIVTDDNKIGTKRKAPSAIENGESYHPPPFRDLTSTIESKSVTKRKK